MIKGCIFDLDGTLVDSLEDLALSVNKVLENHQLPIHELSAYNYFVGNGTRKLMERALGQDHLDILEECLDEFHRVYDIHCLDHTRPYPGIEELISQLSKHNVRMAVVTNKPHHLAIKIVESLFPDNFITILGQQDLYLTKPAPESTHLALMTMKLSRHDCVFIGDSQVDIETAYNADMESIGVSWGFRSESELKAANATYVVSTPNEIMEIVCYDRCK